MKLNLACGKNKLPGWFNVDISPLVAPDEVRDLLHFPWPYSDVEAIFCSHFIEHIGDEFISFMDECHRVLRPGGLLHIRSPYYTSIRCWQDPTHKRAITEATFTYFRKADRINMGVEHYPIKSDFDIGEIRLHYHQDVPQEDAENLRMHAWNVVADIEVLLKKHDPDEQSVDRQAHALVQ